MRAHKAMLQARLSPLLRARSIIFTRAISTPARKYSDADLADHAWRQTNHLWTPQEITEKMETSNLKHSPIGVTDRLVQGLVRSLYHSFNFVTGYHHEDPPVSAIEYRLILLEAFAGVPGFLAAGFRHFRSLRTLQRDHGFIYSLLEEAENERMHLLVCMKMFDAGPVTRSLVCVSQLTATPLLGLLYVVRPQLLHRFVGYLEETAVHTYTNIVTITETEGTQLNAAWKDTKAPEIAIAYWKLDKDALWVDCLRQMLADESHHRDVNHTFADMDTKTYYEQDNPFIHEHIADHEERVAEKAKSIFQQSLEQMQKNRTSSTGPLA